MSGVSDVDASRSSRSRVLDGERRGFVLLVERDLRSLGLATGRHRHLAELDLDRIQRDCRGGLVELQVDCLVALEGVGGKVNGEGEGVMVGRCFAGKALGEAWNCRQQAGDEQRQNFLHGTPLTELNSATRMRVATTGTTPRFRSLPCYFRRAERADVIGKAVCPRARSANSGSSQTSTEVRGSLGRRR